MNQYFKCYSTVLLRSNKASFKNKLNLININTIQMRHLSIFNVFKDVFTRKNPNTLTAARSLLYNCKDIAERSEWYKYGLIGSEFRSIQTLIVIHLWLLHKRLLAIGSEGKIIEEALFDELWEDTSDRIRNLGIDELSVDKNLKAVQSYSFSCCVSLDHAFTYDDKDTIINEIGGVLWRFAYLRNDDIDPDHILIMANYIYKEHNDLKLIDDDAILNGKVAFGSLPIFNINNNSTINNNNKNNDSKKNNNNDDDNNSINIWKKAIAHGGKIYYWNTQTRETTWNKPKDFIEE